MPTSPASASQPFSPGQTLLFDADDTLWENNIYFERAIAAFISYLDHRVHTPEEVRDHLNACERATIAPQGYGLKSFRKSLIDCFEHLTDARLRRTSTSGSSALSTRSRSRRSSCCLRSRRRLPSSPSGIAAAGDQGRPGEQHDKLDRSGLAPTFRRGGAARRKLEAAYRALARHTAARRRPPG